MNIINWLLFFLLVPAPHRTVISSSLLLFSTLQSRPHPASCVRRSSHHSPPNFTPSPSPTSPPPVHRLVGQAVRHLVLLPGHVLKVAALEAARQPPRLLHQLLQVLLLHPPLVRHLGWRGNVEGRRGSSVRESVGQPSHIPVTHTRTCFTTSLESPFTVSRCTPRSLAAARPSSSPSYSACGRSCRGGQAGGRNAHGHE